MGNRIISCPTRSSEGAKVASPSFHLAGHTSPGWLRTYWAAFTLRSRSSALRPMPSAVISTAWITPSGSTMKVPGRPGPRRDADHFEVVGHHAAGVTDHGVLDLADGFGSVVPCLVHEVGVGGHGVDFYAQLLELVVVVSHVAQFGGAHEGEVSGVEEEHSPLAQHVLFGHFDKLAILAMRRLGNGLITVLITDMLFPLCDATEHRL